MDNFIEQFNIFESRTDENKSSLEASQKINSMKEELIRKLKEELERYKTSETERKQKREEAERRRTELKGKLSANITQAKTLSGQIDELESQRVSQAKTDQEIHAKVSNLREQISNVEGKVKELRNDMNDLQQHEPIDPRVVSGVHTMRESITNELAARRDSFDLTSLVAEVQAIESLRKERTEMSEDLAGKTELLCALDADYEAQQGHAEEQQDRLSRLEAEKEELAEVMEKINNRLEELSSRIADITMEIEGNSRELKDLEIQLTEQNEVEQQLEYISHKLEEKKEQYLQEEMLLKELEEGMDKKKKEAALNLETMMKEYEQRIEDLNAQLECCQKANEEIRTEVENMKERECFLNIYKENSRKIEEKHRKLAALKEELEELRKDITEKQEKLTENPKLVQLRQDVESKKRAADKDLENAKVQISDLHDKMLKADADILDLQNKNYEIEGEIHLVRLQLSTKAEELVAAKNEYFLMMEMQEVEKIAKKEKLVKEQNMNKKQRGRKRKQEDAKKDVNSRDQMRKSRVLTDRKARSATRSAMDLREQQLRKEESICNSTRKTQTPTKRKDPMEELVSCDTKKQFLEAPERGEMGQTFSDENKSGSLQHTTTTASTMADDFMDLDDTVMKEDDGGDLFESPNNHEGAPKPKEKADVKLVEKSSLHKSPEADGSEIHFEPSELFTSTPLVIKKQCSVRPTRVKSGGCNSQSAQLSQPRANMPPFRMRSGETLNVPARGRPRGRKNKKR
ncbi:hypothetical protein RB195_008891 [Necator americanus]|uniref:M protein repeat protein n=1 Tax=Necator americanus TaxID=51031 RepID=A0ABR1CQU1_NECAM